METGREDEEVTAYAKRLGADRTYVVVECVRQTLDADRAWKREFLIWMTGRSVQA